MKKIVTKFWGVALIVMLLSTLFVAAAPVSAADPLTWNTESIPGVSGSVLLAGSDVTTMAVCYDGATIYAGAGALNDNVYKTSNAGLTWIPLVNNTGLASTYTVIDTDLVAVPSDSTDVVLVADNSAAGTVTLRLSQNGGSTWSDFGSAALTTLLTSTGGAVTSIAVSAEVNGVRYAAVADSLGGVYTRKFGNAWDEWVDASDITAGLTGYDGFTGSGATYAIAFSPNFQGDRTLAAVGADASGNLTLELLVFAATPNWNISAGITNYPADLTDATGTITSASDASIAFSPDYPGGGEVESITFIGVVSTDTAENGIYRMDDYVSANLKKGVDIYSVAYDGSVLVAGAANGTVYRSENPLDNSPTISGNSNMKAPTSASTTVANVIVAFAGSSVVAGTSGDASAFAVSTDNGRSFADISLIDSAILDIPDVAVSADGSIVYLLTGDNATAAGSVKEISLFRYNGAWQRVLCDVTGGAAFDWIVRIAPANPDAVYVADTGAGSTEMYYSSAGGDTRWYGRSGPGISDMVVESDSVVYAGIVNTATVSKSTNAARFFNDPVSTKLSGGNVANIYLVSENNLIVGSTLGYVAYSTDGNASWTGVTVSATGATASTIAAADGLAAGGHLYASSGGAVNMWTIGQAVTDGWTWTGPLPGNAATTDVVTGMLVNPVGGLWASFTTTFARNSMPWYPELGFAFWSGPYNAGAGVVADTLDNAPSALRLSSADTYMKVWVAGATTLYSWMDTLVVSTPSAIAPSEGTLIPINTTTNLPYNITFTWTRPSLATQYDLWIGLDPFFGQMVVSRQLAANYQTTQSYTLTANALTTEDSNNYGYLSTLIPGTTYYWTVRAHEPVTSNFSAFPGVSFTIEAGSASVPGISSPVNGGTITAGNGAFSWTPVTGATMYVFELSDSPDFTNIIYTYNAANAGVMLPGSVTLTPGKVYFWRVKALSPVEGPYSAIANFTVAVEQATTTASAVTTTVAPVTTTVTTLTIPGTTTNEVNPGYIWAIIIIGAVLVIAVIVLIVRTRRSV